MLAINEFDLTPVALRAVPWETKPSGCGWTDQEDRLTADWLQRNGILVDVNIAAQAVQTVARDRSFHPFFAGPFDYRTKRSDGLHKRSAEAWGDGLYSREGGAISGTAR